MRSPYPRLRFALRSYGPLGRAFARLDRWFELRRTRDALAELDDDCLSDIGLAPDEVRRIRRRRAR